MSVAPDPSDTSAGRSDVPSALPRFLTIAEAAKLLRLNRKTAYEWALTRRLPGAFRLGSQWRVCRDRLLSYVRENSVPSPGETER